jgi:pimeloyl-ACP methyl ester carboxylesterase
MKDSIRALISLPLAALAISVLVMGSAQAAGAEDAVVTYHDISFVSRGATLRGTVYIPGKIPLAAVVWVDGAGERHRNSGVAQLLVEQGLAVLTYDKRGVGQSGGVYAGSEVGTNNVSRENLDVLADDAAAALHSLRREKRLRGVTVGFMGASQAGWIVPVAAVRNPNARFMVLWSGAVETTHEDLAFEQVASSDPAFWDHHTHEEVQETMAGLKDDMTWADLDPREALSKLTIPGLWLFGGRDREVNVDISITRLKGLIAAGHPGYSYRMFPDYDHNLGGDNADVVGPCVAWIRATIGKKSLSR